MEGMAFTGDWFSHNIPVWRRVLGSLGWLDNPAVRLSMLEVRSEIKGSEFRFRATPLISEAAASLLLGCFDNAAVELSVLQVRLEFWGSGLGFKVKS